MAQVNRAPCKRPDGAASTVQFYFRGTENDPAVCSLSIPRQRQEDSHKILKNDGGKCW